jgi:hypothetical protein
MGDINFKRLERYKTGGTADRMNLAVPLPKSPSGKIQRTCPSPSCVPGLFQLGPSADGRSIEDRHRPLVRRSPNIPGTTCPYCGTDGEDSSFRDPRDIEAAKKLVRWAATEDVRDAFRDMFRNFGRNLPRGGPISVKVSSSSTPTPQPLFFREDLLREVACDICSRTYGVYAAALFCPDCGARNIHVHFKRELELIHQQIEVVRKTEEVGNRELAYRLLGNAHEDVLTAFEAYHKAIYKFLVRRREADPEAVKKLCSKKHIGNCFQNIERGRALYERFAFDPYAALTPDALECLTLNIHKRHVLGHNLGMADESYTEVASSGKKVGQNVPVLANEIARFAAICEAVIVRLEEESPEFLPPTPPALPEASPGDDTSS